MVIYVGLEQRLWLELKIICEFFNTDVRFFFKRTLVIVIGVPKMLLSNYGPRNYGCIYRFHLKKQNVHLVARKI